MLLHCPQISKTHKYYMPDVSNGVIPTYKGYPQINVFVCTNSSSTEGVNFSRDTLLVEI